MKRIRIMLVAIEVVETDERPTIRPPKPERPALTKGSRLLDELRRAS